MIEFEHILCPIDFSDTSIRALTYAAAFADWYEAQLEVLHVVPAFEEAGASGQSRRLRHSQTSPALRDHARQRLHAQLAQEPTTWCEIEQVVAIDRAYKAVLQHAVESKVDLVVMGARGTAGLELMVYGSNTQHVVRAATCPVLTVHA